MILSLLRALRRRLDGRYEPALHYMRGPGPKSASRPAGSGPSGAPGQAEAAGDPARTGSEDPSRRDAA